MRLYSPGKKTHLKFLRQYPDHRPVDERSLADFLTALCIYDRIRMESSSGWNEKRLVPDEGSGDLAHRDPRWVDQLKQLLPPSVSSLIDSFPMRSARWQEEQSSARAFDIMTSPTKELIRLEPDEAIPSVYFADDYVYRPIFDGLNKESGYALTLPQLAQAMFLHRGLFLQSGAHSCGHVYMPYYYRGKMLSKLPPMAWALAKGVDALGDLSSYRRRDSPDYGYSYIGSLNDYYYSLLQAATWTTYDTKVPFIGAAILATAKGSPAVAIDIAMECREKGVLRRRFEALDAAIRASDRPRFEALLSQYRSELSAAARQFGVSFDDSSLNSFYKLATAWMPKGIQTALDAAVKLLPANVRLSAREVASTLITKSPLQMLFVEHVSALRS